ncbi:hypothetical protein BD779DRAFT_1432544 [Infundibulicybe gibba]|nr:hypothetical protein BD779DRAFT_1432544 [Infundibulicybe gibba]
MKVQDAEYELDELEDEYESDSDPNVFKIRDPLKPASAKIFTTRELHALIHDGMIDLNPIYQRDVVWPVTKQIGLIDSIFRNFYIPPIVFAVSRDDEGEEIRICVDGKQRLTSIQKFFDGQVNRDLKTRKVFWYTVPGGAKGSRAEVPEEYKEIFSEKQITCVEYKDLKPVSEREIFQRVQLGMPLTAAEKLQAIASPWAEWISELESRHVSVEGGLSTVLEWDTKRGLDFQNLAFFVYCCDGLPSHQLPTTSKLEKWLLREDRPPEQFKNTIELVLRDFWMVATEPRLTYWKTTIKKRIAPVEFIFLGVLLFLLRHVDISDRASALYQLRRQIREQFTDIRNNTITQRVIWNIIDELEHDPTGKGKTVSSKAKGKRKRQGVKDDSEEEEYRPEPVRNLGKTPKTRSRYAK